MSRQPDERGRFGRFGGRFVPETLIPALTELERVFRESLKDEHFQRELHELLLHYVGRPTPLYFAQRLTEKFQKGSIYLKREDLNHTGAHKINNALGQALLAKRMGKKRVIAETGAGQHGVATATAAALLDLECLIYMGEEDMQRQALNVFRMRLLGAEVQGVASGSKTLKDATNEAIRDWVTNVENTHYIIGSVVGPHPYPWLVRELQSIIGRETKEQAMQFFGRNPDYIVACVGGGSNAMGMFAPFIDEDDVTLIGVEAAGHGLESGRHSASLAAGRPGVLHGSLSYLLQTEDGQVQTAHSISAGLDYPGVGPEHAHLLESGRVKYVHVTDAEALQALQLLAETEGIICALESAHAMAYLAHLMPQTSPDDNIVICLSGRGDKDVEQVAVLLGEER